MKKKWIIIRGLGRGHGHWGTFIQTFESAFPEDHFYWIDIPGNGYLNDKDTPLTIPEFIPLMEQQLQLSNFSEIDGEVYGLGLSLGGMVLVEWAKKLKFKKLFLINTSASNFSKPWQRISVDVIINTFKQLRTKEIPDIEMNSLLITTSLSKSEILKKYRKSYEAIIEFTKKFPITKANVYRQLLAASYFKFPQIAPTEVVLFQGLKDKFVHYNCSNQIQKKWNCKMISHPEAGHDIAFEDSQWVIEKLKNNL